MFATPWNTDDRTVGLRTLAQAPDGVTFAYEVLEQVATGLEAGDAWMVVKPPGMGSQVFGRPGRMLAPPVAGALADRPAGIYVAPAPGGLVADGGLVQVAEVLLGADHARRTSAVDARSGLATSWALDMALERATACAARYGWPCTVVVLSTAGDADGASRFDALCGALRAALRSGDEAGVARAGEVVAILGSAGTDVVRPFVGRVRAAMNAGGASDADLLVGAARAPDESVDPAEILRLAGERLASEREAAGAEPGAARGEPEAAGGEPGTSAEGGGSAALELELRSLPGVIGVQRGDGQRLTVLVRGAEEDLRSRARLALARRGLSALREAAPTEASDPLTMLDVSVVRVPERPGLEVVPDVQDLSAGSTEPGAGGAGSGERGAVLASTRGVAPSGGAQSGPPRNELPT